MAKEDLEEEARETTTLKDKNIEVKKVLKKALSEAAKLVTEEEAKAEKIAAWRQAHWKRRLAEIGLGLLAIVLTVSLVLALTNPFTLGITTALVLGAVAGAVAGAGIALLARYSRYIMPGIPGVSTIGKWYRSLKENHPKKVFAIKTLLFAGAVTGLVFASIFLPALPILFFEPTKAIVYMGLATFGATFFGANIMGDVWSWKNKKQQKNNGIVRYAGEQSQSQKSQDMRKMSIPLNAEKYSSLEEVKKNIFKNVLKKDETLHHYLLPK